MRILMLVSHPNIRGPLPKHSPELINALRNLGCDLTTEHWGRYRDDESFFDKIVGRTRDIVRIRRAFARERFDVLVITTAHDWATLCRDISLLVIAQRLCPRIVLMFHGSSVDRLVAPGSGLFKAASKWLLRLSDAALVLSSEEQRQWQQFYPAGRFYVVSNPFVLKESRTGATPARLWNVSSKVPVLLFVGRLIREKGIFDLLEALAILKKRVDCHLLVVGDGPQAPQVREHVQGLGLADCVTLTGYIEGEHLAAAYQTADVFALPTYHSEGFPTVVTEAMSVRLPVVTTPIRGAADHLQEGIHALFVPPRAPGALAEAIVRLLADPDLRERMGRANREKVKDFTPEKVGRQYLDVLQEVLGSEAG
jgi:glycosyltransferase involved in cell wall biosynthesis